MSQIDKVKDRIRKLLNLAENDAASEGEINNAINFAQRLMQEHHLTKDDVHAAAAAEEVAEMMKQAAYTTGAKASPWEAGLASFVAKMIGSVGVYTGGVETAKTTHGTTMFDAKGKPMSRSTYVFYGEAEEVRLATELYYDLSRTIAAMARMRYGGALRGDGRDYGLGFVSGLASQLAAAATAAKAESTESTALAVRCAAIVHQKKAAASTWLSSQGINLSTGRRRFTGGSGNAY